MCYKPGGTLVSPGLTLHIYLDYMTDTYTPDDSIQGSFDDDLLKIYSDSLKQNFDLPCLTDYTTGETITYGDFARRIARLHLLFRQAGINEGDKIALLGKNNITWVTVFFATITYGATIVPILSDFNPRDAQHIINHSDSRLLFVSDRIMESLHFDAMPNLMAAISLDNRHLIEERPDPTGALPDLSWVKLLRNLTRRFRSVYKRGFSADDIDFPQLPSTHPALINYTSGTTGFSKGVVLSLGNLAGNVVFGIRSHLHFPGSRALSFLPLAHAYGCAFDMLVPIAVGTHVTLLGATPTPRILLKALAEVKPSLIICVPLILEKIYRRQIVPMITRKAMRWALAIPLLDKAIYAKIREKLIQAFGGEFEEVIVGGAPLNPEVESFLRQIKFPFTVGYGMTECGPLISYTPWREFIPTSAGHTLRGFMTARIDSPDPANTSGEILVRGTNVMLGYYKNPEATHQAIDSDGWLHTGDMGTLGGDDGQTIFIRGRSKTMILSANGQNIYPEEIEAKLNNMPFVAESLVVERNGQLIALVFPDSEAADIHGLKDEEINEAMENTRREVNSLLAPYEALAAIELVDREFIKTPKRSIKRYLYR